jgi:DNA-binding MarR family transcriptional regulator
VTDELTPPWNTGFALSRLGSQVRLAFTEALAPHRVRPAHYGVLACLSAGGPLSQRELAAATGIDTGDLVGFLDELASRGLAVRAPDPTDRRRHLVSVTPEGRELARELDTVAAEVNAAFLASLSDDERQTLEAILAKLWAVHRPGGQAGGRASRRR